jgi:hypothetical protein
MQRQYVRDPMTIGLLRLTIAIGLGLPLAARAGAQATPPVRDTTRRDTTRITTLEAIRSEATRVERQLFDEKPNVGRLSISGKELSAAPKMFSEADLLRAVQLLPGVEARNDFNAGLNVRGGEADQNLVLLDGYPIYNPFHLGGLFGTFVEPTVGRVDLFTGGFPAPYGGRLSSVLDVGSATEERPGVHGTANVSLIASSGSVGSPIRNGAGSWMIAARRTYIDKAIDLLTPGRMPYDFQDAQSHVRYSFGNGLRVAATAYLGHDAFDYNESGDSASFSWGNRVFGTTIARTFGSSPRIFGLPLGDSAVVEQRISLSKFEVKARVRDGVFEMRNPLQDVRTGGMIASFAGTHTRSVGYEIASQRFHYESNAEIPLFVQNDTTSQALGSVGMYVDDLWKPTTSLIIDAGLRFDAVSTNGWKGLSPRLSAKYFLTPDVAVTAAFGQYAQWIRSLAREEVPVRPMDFWVGTNADWPVSTSRHYILGTEGWINRNRGFRVEGFLKTYHDLLERNPRDDAQLLGDEFLFLKGRSLGFDVMLRQFRTRTFSGWAAYTFAISERTSLDGTTFSPAQDRRHDLNLVGGWEFKRYTLGARYNLATGTPYSYISGMYDRWRYDPIQGSYNESDPQFLTGERNGSRLPATHRLDLGATRHGHIRGVAVSPYLSIVNTTNAKNVFTYAFDYTERPPTRVSIHQLSIVPTLGVSIAW